MSKDINYYREKGLKILRRCLTKFELLQHPTLMKFRISIEESFEFGWSASKNS
jgi:hypothetical protein